MKIFTVLESESGRTLLKYVEAIFKDVPKSRIERLFRQKDISLNGRHLSDRKTLLKGGDIVVVYRLETSRDPVNYATPVRNLKIIYEDKNIVVISKAPGVVMHGSALALDYEVCRHLQFQQTSSFTPSSIGRLDKVTSGLIIYGKNYHAVRNLKTSQKEWTKLYAFKSDLLVSTTTAFRFGYDKTSQKQKPDPKGKMTRTVFNVTKTTQTAQIITGRKHQIRASLAKLGFPIHGDKKYGGKNAARVFLHCQKIVISGLKGELAYLNNRCFYDAPQW